MRELENLKIKCLECGKYVHFIEKHILAGECSLKSIDEYKGKYPNTPILSDLAEYLLNRKKLNFEKAKNKVIDFDIKKTFGVNLGGKLKFINGFEKPFINTPKIDENYVFEKKTIAPVLYALSKYGEKVYLVGHTGTGKSTLVEQVCARLNLMFYRVNMDANMTRADLVGQWVLKGEKMEFMYGVLPRAMREGAVLLIDEFDTGSPEVMMLLQAVLDNGKLMLTETGEVIEADKDFRIFATANTKGLGDDSGLYAGTQAQNFATMNRFSMIIEVDYLPIEVEFKILRNIFKDIDKIFVNKIIDFANKVRSAFKNEEINCVISTRTLINIVDKFYVFGDLKFALNISFCNLINKEDKKVINEIFQRIFDV